MALLQSALLRVYLSVLRKIVMKLNLYFYKYSYFITSAHSKQLSAFIRKSDSKHRKWIKKHDFKTVYLFVDRSVFHHLTEHCWIGWYRFLQEMAQVSDQPKTTHRSLHALLLHKHKHTHSLSPHSVTIQRCKIYVRFSYLWPFEWSSVESVL